MIKTCTACKEELDINLFRTRLMYGKDYVVARCKKCEQVINKKQCDKDRRRKRERERNADPDRRNKKNEFQRNWRKNNIDKSREYHRSHIKKNVDNLSDVYVIRNIIRLWGVNKEDLIKNPDLIKAYRENMKLKRLIKEMSTKNAR